VAARRAGCAALRIALRGADRRGEDVYHGGLTADLHAAITSPELAGYERVVVIGYSMGGHAALWLAAEPCDPRVAAVAAICAPLDLAAVQRHMDGPRAVVYRRYLLGGMAEIYEAVYRRRGGPISVEQARRMRRFVDFDDAIIAPRFGFADAADYYRQASAARILGDVRIPALLVFERGDPMVPERVVRPFLGGASARVDVRWMDRGGHVGFPPGVDLGVRAPLGVEAQVMGWLLERAGVTPGVRAAGR
jgi:predicted alpha/beta-fold hydrolase